jgi:hypothetical protein
MAEIIESCSNGDIHVVLRDTGIEETISVGTTYLNDGRLVANEFWFRAQELRTVIRLLERMHDLILQRNRRNVNARESSPDTPLQQLAKTLLPLIRERRLFDPRDSNRFSAEAWPAFRECEAEINEAEINLMARRVLGDSQTNED